MTHLLLDGHGPLHAQLTRALKAGILHGRFPGGTRLPPSRLLATEYGLSRNTVLAAYDQLRAEGFIEPRVGAGSFVARCGPAADGGTGLPGHLEPAPSAFAARARSHVRVDRLAGRDVPGVRHAFQYGVPLANPAVTTAWARALSRAALYTPPGYPRVPGLRDLRDALCRHLAAHRGIQAEPDDVLIVAGTQQALSLTARVLVDPGRDVAIEEPHYDAVRSVLLAHGAHLRPVPVDAHGLRCDELPRASPRLVCVTPSHQFPTGAALSLQRRLQLLDYADRHQAWIFEDDYDGEFRYTGRPLAALRSLDRSGRVIYVGTFSKSIFPSLRMGYLLMPRALRQDFMAAKWLDDFGSPAIEQAALARFMADGGFERHLRRSARALAERRGVLLDGLRAISRGRIEIADAGAGMHLLAWLPGRSRADGDALVDHARQRGLGLYPIAPYYLQPPDRAGLLMGYAGLSPVEIRAALVVFGECLDALFPA